MAISRRVVLRFPRSLLDQPIICQLVRDYDLTFNILKASITPREEGLMVLELSGQEGNYQSALNYLSEWGISVESLSKTVIRDEAKCVHCGACTAICPGNALDTDLSTMLVNFDDTKCLACGLCIKVCPFRAMEMRL